MIARELLPLIDPNLHPKYSPNLYKWIRKNWESTDRNIVVTKEAERNRLIGFLDVDGWISGTQLNRVLCNGSREKAWAFTANHYNAKAGVDGTFWGRYIRDGRCAIDTDHQTHFIGGDTRWKYDGKVRECLWCGNHVQVQLGWSETVNHSAWVPA